MSLSHIILGILNQQPLSGYDLNKEFNSTVAHFWQTEQSQIYRTLHKLEEDDYVTVETIIQEHTPNKKIYSITKAGREALHTWLRKTKKPPAVRDAQLASLFFGAEIEPETVIAQVEHWLQTSHTQLQILQAIKENIPPESTMGHWQRHQIMEYLTLDYGIYTYTLEIEWLEKTLRLLREMQAQDQS